MKEAVLILEDQNDQVQIVNAYEADQMGKAKEEALHILENKENGFVWLEKAVMRSDETVKETIQNSSILQIFEKQNGKLRTGSLKLVIVHLDEGKDEICHVFAQDEEQQAWNLASSLAENPEYAGKILLCRGAWFAKENQLGRLLGPVKVWECDEK